MGNSGKSCECSPSEENDKHSAKSVKIKWKRLTSKGETCPRCGSTEQEIEKAISTLKQSFAPLGIEVILEKEQISENEFQKDPLQSNKIWINDRLLEDWIGGKVGQSPCCDVCGTHNCRTVEIQGQTYDTIPSELIIKAGLSAASQLDSMPTRDSCCGDT